VTRFLSHQKVGLDSSKVTIVRQVVSLYNQHTFVTNRSYAKSKHFTCKTQLNKRLTAGCLEEAAGVVILTSEVPKTQIAMLKDSILFLGDFAMQIL